MVSNTEDERFPHRDLHSRSRLLSRIFSVPWVGDRPNLGQRRRYMYAYLDWMVPVPDFRAAMEKLRQEAEVDLADRLVSEVWSLNEAPCWPWISEPHPEPEEPTSKRFDELRLKLVWGIGGSDFECIASHVLDDRLELTWEYKHPIPGPYKPRAPSYEGPNLAKIERTLVLCLKDCLWEDEDDWYISDNEPAHVLLWRAWEAVTDWLIQIRQGKLETLVGYLLRDTAPKPKGAYQMLVHLGTPKVDIVRQSFILEQYRACKAAVNHILDTHVAIDDVKKALDGWLLAPRARRITSLNSRRMSPDGDVPLLVDMSCAP
ncbi:hypothetical protein AUP68_03838 [Ilyonectria robusta]